MHFKKHKLAVALLALSALSASAATVTLSFSGLLDATDPNDVLLQTFTLVDASTVSIQSFGFGGTASAPGGTNGAGQVIAAGGFDNYLSLFVGSGPLAVFYGSNDDGVCPPGTAVGGFCADASFLTALLAPGTYTVALTSAFNYSLAENLGTGNLGDGFIGLNGDWSSGSCTGTCTSAYAFDVSFTTTATPVPEAPTSALAALGGFLLALRSRSRSRHAATVSSPSTGC